MGCEFFDIGKIAIPDSVLNKTGKLSDQEFTLIKEHPLTGKLILMPLLQDQNDVLDIIYSHHERYDGKGYPDGLSGDKIPLCARIVSLADAFDAMISPRPYHQKMGIDQALNEIKDNQGTQFDPDIVKFLLECY